MSKPFEMFEATVPLPPLKHNFGSGTRTPVYPFEQLKLGEFAVVKDTSAKAFGGTVRAAEKRTGFAFAVRSGPIEYNGETVVPAGAIGVWRIAQKAPRKPRTHKPENVATKKAA